METDVTLLDGSRPLEEADDKLSSVARSSSVVAASHGEAFHAQTRKNAPTRS
jgi:hypothetical protein